VVKTTNVACGRMGNGTDVCQHARVFGTQLLELALQTGNLCFQMIALAEQYIDFTLNRTLVDDTPDKMNDKWLSLITCQGSKFLSVSFGQSDSNVMWRLWFHCGEPF
jgi:hypothetical protein